MSNKIFCFSVQAKQDKARRSGSTPQNFDEIDNIVLEIIGRDSPIIQGLPISKSMKFSEEDVIVIHQLQISPPEEATSSADPLTLGQKRKTKATSKTGATPLSQLKYRRLELQNRKL